MKNERTALAVIEEAIQLLRAAPISVYALYAAGVVPFLLVFFNFCAQMSYSRDAAVSCGPSAFVVAVSYFWMKGMQAFCCRELICVYTGNITPLWKPREMLSIWSRQIAVQPLGMILKPLAWLLFLPGALITTFFQNISIVGGTGSNDVKKSWNSARLWPKQSLAVFGMIALLSQILLFDLYMLVIAIPIALKSFLGIESFLTRSFSWVYSSVLFIALAAIAYFLTDLLVKAIGVVRFCDSEALASGEDLLRRLQKVKRSEGFVRAP